MYRGFVLTAGVVGSSPGPGALCHVSPILFPVSSSAALTIKAPKIYLKSNVRSCCHLIRIPCTTFYFPPLAGVCRVSGGFIKKKKKSGGNESDTSSWQRLPFDDWQRRRPAFSTLHFEPQLGPVAV